LKKDKNFSIRIPSLIYDRLTNIFGGPSVGISRAIEGYLAIRDANIKDMKLSGKFSRSEFSFLIACQKGIEFIPAQAADSEIWIKNIDRVQTSQGIEINSDINFQDMITRISLLNYMDSYFWQEIIMLLLESVKDMEKEKYDKKLEKFLDIWTKH
jgi:hypothetical protein